MLRSSFHFENLRYHPERGCTVDIYVLLEMDQPLEPFAQWRARQEAQVQRVSEALALMRSMLRGAGTIEFIDAGDDSALVGVITDGLEVADSDDGDSGQRVPALRVGLSLRVTNLQAALAAKPIQGAGFAGVDPHKH